MAELVDARDSKSRDRKVMRVRFSLPAPDMNQKKLVGILLVSCVALLIGVAIFFAFTKKQLSQSTQPETSASRTQDLHLAKQALSTYFNLLNTKQYDLASVYHGGGYEALQNWNTDISPNDHAALLKRGCETNGWQCLKVKNVLQEKQVSQDEFFFMIEFEKAQWSTGSENTFIQEPCCGDAATGQRKTNFEYTVRKVGDYFIIMNPPVYVS